MMSFLKGVIDYEVEQQQFDPRTDMGKLFDLVKPSIHFDVQRNNLSISFGN